MTDKQQMVAAFIAAMIGQSGVMEADKADLAQANKIADAILKGEKKNGKNDDADDDDTDEDGDSDDSDSDDSEGEDEDSDSDESEEDDDEGNADDEDTEDEDDDADDGDEEEKQPGKKGKKPNKKSPQSTAGAKAGKAKSAPAKGKKTFKKKPQSYARDNDTHKEIFSGVLKAVKADWKKSAALKKRAKDASVKLEGKDFLDAEGEVLTSFKQSVKKLMAAK